LNGDPVRKILACIACHSEVLSSGARAIAGLNGLPRDYITRGSMATDDQVDKYRSIVPK